MEQNKKPKELSRVRSRDWKSSLNDIIDTFVNNAIVVSSCQRTNKREAYAVPVNSPPCYFYYDNFLCPKQKFNRFLMLKIL